MSGAELLQGEHKRNPRGRDTVDARKCVCKDFITAFSSCNVTRDGCVVIHTPYMLQQVAGVDVSSTSLRLYFIFFDTSCVSATSALIDAVQKHLFVQPPSFPELQQI